MSDYNVSYFSVFIQQITMSFLVSFRSLYYKKGFELIGSYQKRFAWGMVGLNMFRLSKKVNESNDD